MKSFPYKDIVSLPHHVSATRPQMARKDRAAQFAPFAALSGYDAAIAEAARLTDAEQELSDTALEELNRQYQILAEHIAEQPEVTFSFFVPDNKKPGGSYVTKTGRVQKVDGYKKRIVLTDGSSIPMGRVMSMDGSCLENNN